MKNIDSQLLALLSHGDVNDALECLLRGADVNAKEDDGLDYNTLMITTINGHTRGVELLLNHGVDKEAKNAYGITALIIASEYNHIEIIKMLLEHSANINVHNRLGHSCLYYNESLWKKQEIQELIISKQPHNIKLLDDEIGGLLYLIIF